MLYVLKKKPKHPTYLYGSFHTEFESRLTLGSMQKILSPWQFFVPYPKNLTPNSHSYE